MTIEIRKNDNHEGYKKWHFPSGELGIEITSGSTEVYAEVYDSESIMELFLVLNALRQREYPSSHELVITLDLPYIPFGRQDRSTHAGTPFSLKVFADMLNQFQPLIIRTLTPHSNVSELLIKNLDAREPVEELEEFLTNDVTSYTNVTPMGGHIKIPDWEDVVFIAPDAGAEKRVYTLANYMQVKDVYLCGKRRDPATGHLTSFYADPNIPDDKHLVVIDDICDGGGTFCGLAEILPKKRKSLNLFVTHGIFSKGREVLKLAGYDNVFAAVNFIEEENNYVLDNTKENL